MARTPALRRVVMLVVPLLALAPGCTCGTVSSGGELPEDASADTATAPDAAPDVAADASDETTQDAPAVPFAL